MSPDELGILVAGDGRRALTQGILRFLRKQAEEGLERNIAPRLRQDEPRSSSPPAPEPNDPHAPDTAQAPDEFADPATPEPQRRLRRALEAAGEVSKGDGRDPHHIVPRGGIMSGDRDPLPAQRRLDLLGIDLESADNGVVLSRPFHQRLHTGSYYEFVRSQLRRASTPEQARRTLRELADQLRQADKRFQIHGSLPSFITGE